MFVMAGFGRVVWQLCCSLSPALCCGFVLQFVLIQGNLAGDVEVFLANDLGLKHSLIKTVS